MEHAGAMEPLCPKLELMAVLEEAAGFEANARGLMAAAGDCPGVGCRFFTRACTAGSPALPSAAILPFRAPSGPKRRLAGVAPLIALKPAGRTGPGPATLDALRTPGDRLGKLLSAWERLPRQPAACVADLDPIELVEIGLLGYLHLLDTTALAPEAFRIRLWGRRLPVRGRTDFAGVRVADLPSPSLAAALMDQAAAVRDLGMPLVAGIEQTRLMLPLSVDGARIDHVLVGVRPEAAGAAALPGSSVGAT